MDFEELVSSKNLKPKEKTEILSAFILTHSEKIDQLISFAESSKDSIKATCIEAIEYSTKTNSEISNLNCLQFVSKSLTDKAPRVKWESAKVIGNIAHLYPTKLDEAIKNLLLNANHSGTVVRWSAAYALAQILKLKTRHQLELISTINFICDREEKNSIKKIYQEALKKITK